MADIDRVMARISLADAAPSTQPSPRPEHASAISGARFGSGASTRTQALRFGLLLASLALSSQLVTGCMFSRDQPDFSKIDDVERMGQVAIAELGHPDGNPTVLYLDEKAHGGARVVTWAPHRAKDDPTRLSLVQGTIGVERFAIGDLNDDGQSDLVIARRRSDGRVELEFWLHADQSEGESLLNRSSQTVTLDIPRGRRICEIIVGRFRATLFRDIAVLLDSNDADIRRDILYVWHDGHWPAQGDSTLEVIDERTELEAEDTGDDARFCMDMALQRQVDWVDEPGTAVDLLIAPDGRSLYAARDGARTRARDAWQASVLVDAVDDRRLGPLAGIEMIQGALDDDREFDLVVAAWFAGDPPSSLLYIEHQRSDANDPRSTKKFFADRRAHQLAVGRPSHRDTMPLVYVGFDDLSIAMFEITETAAGGSNAAYARREAAEVSHVHDIHLPNHDSPPQTRPAVADLVVGNVEGDGIDDVVASILGTPEISVFWNPQRERGYSGQDDTTGEPQ